MKIKRLIPCLLLISLVSFASTDTWRNNFDSTVIDVATGLIWQQTGNSTNYTYAEAVDYCANLSLADKNDWRLPSIKELVSINDFRADSPSIDLDAFPIPPNDTFFYSGGFWSNTSDPTFASNRWTIVFIVGDTQTRNESGGGQVRCVR